MRWFRFAVLILIVTVLQASLVDIIAVSTAGIKPDLLLILLVFFGVYGGSSEVGIPIVTSFTIGFAADIIGPAMGPQTISFGLVGTALANLHRIIAIRRIPYQSVVIFISGFFAGGLALFLASLKDESFTSNIYGVLLWIPLYSAIVGPFLFLSAAWLMRIKTDRLRRY